MRYKKLKKKKKKEKRRRGEEVAKQENIYACRLIPNEPHHLNVPYSLYHAYIIP